MHSMLWNVWLPDLRPAARSDRPPGGMAQVMAAALRERGLAEARIGVASPSTISVAHADALRKELPDAQVDPRRRSRDRAPSSRRLRSR